jgi:hypothetical protein
MCKGPILGHKISSNECDESEMRRDLVDVLEKLIEEHEAFSVTLAKIDKRSSVIKCNRCGLISESRYNAEEHVCLHHDVVVQVDNDGIIDKILHMMSINNANLTAAVKGMKDPSGNRKIGAATQITKAKLPPAWIGTDFKRWSHEVESWVQLTKESTQEKFHSMIESLKKNTEVKSSIIMHILDQTIEKADQTVENVMKILSEIFSKSTIEKAKSMFQEVVQWSMLDGESYEQYKDRFLILMTDLEREEMITKFKYLMSVLFIEGAKNIGKLNAEEVW